MTTSHSVKEKGQLGMTSLTVLQYR